MYCKFMLEQRQQFIFPLLINLCIIHCIHSVISIEDKMENKIGLMIHQNLLSGDIRLNLFI